MEHSSFPATISRGVQKVWTQAQLLIAFHRDPDQKQRDEPYLWHPKNGRAGLKDDPTDQEAFVNIQGKDRADDVQLKLRADRIIARRKTGRGWSGVEMTDHEVRVLVDGIWIEVATDGTVTRRAEDSVTYLEGDGGIIKVSEGAEIAVTADGTEVTRRTEHRIEALTPDGVVSRARRSTSDGK